MKQTILFLLLILGLNLSAAAQTKNDDFWIGNFSYGIAEMNANETRSYVQTYDLEIKRENGKLTAFYSATENADPRGDRLILDVKIMGDTASFFYRGCDDKNRDEADQTTDFECSAKFKAGDLLFKLVRNGGAAKKPKFLTYWGKLKLASRTGGVYFEKT